MFQKNNPDYDGLFKIEEKLISLLVPNSLTREVYVEKPELRIAWRTKPFLIVCVGIEILSNWPTTVICVGMEILCIVPKEWLRLSVQLEMRCELSARNPKSRARI